MNRLGWQPCPLGVVVVCRIWLKASWACLGKTHHHVLSEDLLLQLLYVFSIPRCPHMTWWCLYVILSLPLATYFILLFKWLELAFLQEIRRLPVVPVCDKMFWRLALFCTHGSHICHSERAVLLSKTLVKECSTMMLQFSSVYCRRLASNIQHLLLKCHWLDIPDASRFGWVCCWWWLWSRLLHLMRLNNIWVLVIWILSH